MFILLLVYLACVCLIEFTTILQKRKMSFKAEAGGLKLAVKGPVNATVDICHGLQTYKKASLRPLMRPTCIIMNPDKYNNYWISWTSEALSVGKDGQEEPIVTYPEKQTHLAHAMFIMGSGETGNVHWRVELAPKIPRPVHKHIDGGKVEWVRSGNQVPWNAVIGGYENETLYIIRAPYENSLAVGKFVPSQGVGYITCGLRSHKITGAELEFLVGYDCRWVLTGETNDSDIPVEAIHRPRAIVGGYYEQYLPRQVFIGRARCKTHLIPGEVIETGHCCNTPYKGRVVCHNIFEVLTQS